jgi:hypothetical protein
MNTFVPFFKIIVMIIAQKSLSKIIVMMITRKVLRDTMCSSRMGTQTNGY